MAEGLTQEQLAAIGRVTVSFSGLEAVVSSLAWKLIGDQAAGRIVTARMTFSRVIDLAVVLAKEKIKDPKLIAELESLLPDVREAARLRNDVVHSVWSSHLRGIPDVPGTFYRVDVTIRKGKLAYDIEPHPNLNGLEHVAEVIDNASTNFLNFLIRHDLTGG